MSVPDRDRIASLPLERKVELLTGAAYFALQPAPELGLGEIRMSDGPTGVRGTEPGTTSALFPNATLLAASWDEAELERVGQVVAEEAEAQRVHVVLGPTINLHRTPLGGRLFEMYAEDPLLTGRLAAAYVRGVQAGGVAACLKHLVANESETERTTVSSEVDEATLREVYLLPFQIAIEDAHPWTLMAAYNDVNGVPASEHPFLLRQVLREEWGWDGLVVSDWGATKSTAAAAAGLDLVMPGPQGPWGRALVEAVRSGAVEETAVDEHVERILRLGRRVGATVPERSWRDDVPAPAERRAEFIRLAAAGMTVLTNSGVLPLSRDARIAVIGRHALATIGMGGGSAEVNPPYVVTIADGLAAAGAEVTVVDGVEVRERLAPAQAAAIAHPTTGAPGMQILRYAGDDLTDERAAPTGKQHLSGRFDRVVLVADVTVDGPAAVGVIGVGRWRVQVGDGEFGTELTCSGRTLGEESLAPPTAATGLPASRGTRIVATAEITDAFRGRVPWGTWGLSVRPHPVDDETLIHAAAEAAAAADVAVVTVGLTEEQETEAMDKRTLVLPGRQDDLVRRVAAVARRTVVVVNAATPVLMPWVDEVDAVLWVGFPGQESGHAVASALFGDVEPSGRLVTTFPSADGATPAWDVEPVDGRVRYSEGAFVGYRGHAAGRAPAPLFWFGHGLGYATWEYDAVDVRGAGVVAVTLRNTGTRASREVVQVYLQPDDPALPVRLAGWAGAHVRPGEAATVEVHLDPRALQRWSGDRFVPVGSGELLVARGLGDVRLRRRLEQSAG